MKTTKDDENWPKSPFPQEESRSESRRRLAEVTDKWKAEEEEFMQQMMRNRQTTNNLRRTSSTAISGDHHKNSNLNKSNTVIDKHSTPESKATVEARQMQQGLPSVDSAKTCNNPNAQNPPCPPTNLSQICDKYNGGKFETCFQACKKSVCCTHDSKRKAALTCAETAPNCENWIPCYIVWWKLADTVGPAPYLRVSQTDDFFNLDVNFIKEEMNLAYENDIEEDIKFYEQWFGRFIDDDNKEDIDDAMFEVKENWDLHANKI